MRKVKIFEVKMEGEDKVLCILGWDEEEKKIVILKGKYFGGQTLAESYVDKRNMKMLSVKDGIEFFEAFPYMIAGSHCYAGEIYDE